MDLPPHMQTVDKVVLISLDPRYVAMHTMQENHGDDGPSHEESHGNGYLDGPHGRDAGRHKAGQSLQLVMAAVAGMLLPLLTQIGHVH